MDASPLFLLEIGRELLVLTETFKVAIIQKLFSDKYIRFFYNLKQISKILFNNQKITLAKVALYLNFFFCNFAPKNNLSNDKQSSDKGL